jgi:hypothetical protein
VSDTSEHVVEKRREWKRVEGECREKMKAEVIGRVIKEKERKRELKRTTKRAVEEEGREIDWNQEAHTLAL